MRNKKNRSVSFALFFAAGALFLLPSASMAATYVVVDPSNCSHSFAGITYAYCNANESCTQNSSASSGYLCVPTATVQSGMPASNSYTTPGCNNECPPSSQCTENSLAIPTTYFCSPQSSNQPSAPLTDCSKVQGGCQLQYTPLEPLSSPTGGQTPANLSNLGAYLNYLFPILISIGGLIGVVMFTVGGIIYMTSSVAGDKSRAIERMKASTWGLLLLIASVLILRIINPQLVVFNLQSLGCASQGGTIDPATGACTIVPSNSAQLSGT